MIATESHAPYTALLSFPSSLHTPAPPLHPPPTEPVNSAGFSFSIVDSALCSDGHHGFSSLWVSFSLSATPAAAAADVAAAVAAAAAAATGVSPSHFLFAPLSFTPFLSFSRCLQSDWLPAFFHSSSTSFSLPWPPLIIHRLFPTAASSWFFAVFLPEILLLAHPRRERKCLAKDERSSFEKFWKRDRSVSERSMHIGLLGTVK